MHDFVACRRSNELCWYAEENDGRIQICVAGWRVPLPPPQQIQVIVHKNGEQREEGEPAGARQRPESTPLNRKRENLRVKLCRRPNGGDRLRFDPEGPPSRWPVGSLYLPKALLGDGREKEIWLWIEWMDLPIAEPATARVPRAAGAAI